VIGGATNVANVGSIQHDKAATRRTADKSNVEKENLMTERYRSVNGVWPDAIPPLTAQEAVTGTKRLYRLVMKKPFQGKVRITSGNRRGVAIRYGEMIINPDRGWREVVHSLSHRCHFRLYPNHRPHDGRGTHAFVERMMIEHVIKSGWLEGKLRRPEKPKANVDLKRLRYARICARIERWEAEARRAECALKRLAAKRAYYARTLSPQ
jgi:hypothetical protein